MSGQYTVLFTKHEQDGKLNKTTKQVCEDDVWERVLAADRYFEIKDDPERWAIVKNHADERAKEWMTSNGKR